MLQLIKSLCAEPQELQNCARRQQAAMAKVHQVRAQYPSSTDRISFCLDQVPPTDTRTLSEAQEKDAARVEPRAEADRHRAGQVGQGDRDACGAIRSRCKPLIRSCRYLQILSNVRNVKKLRL